MDKFPVMELYNCIKHSRKAIMWTLIVVALIVKFYRQASVTKDLARLHRENWYDNEKKLVEGLVQGCAVHQRVKWLPLYFVEPLFGPCRDLRRAPLANTHLSGAKLVGANLAYTDFRNADLSHADLSWSHASGPHRSEYVTFSGADLSYANLFSAALSGSKLDNANFFSSNLHSADLSHTNLLDANLRNAELGSANLSSAFLRDADLTNSNLNNAEVDYTYLDNTNFQTAILLNTNFDSAKNLTHQQLEGDKPPFICNVRFPEYIELDPNRDCDQIAQVLHQRYPKRFKRLEKAKEFVNEQRQNSWN